MFIHGIGVVGASTGAGDLLVADDGPTDTAVPRSDRNVPGPAGLGIILADGESGERVSTLVGGRDTAPVDRRGSTGELARPRDRVERQAETIEWSCFLLSGYANSGCVAKTGSRCSVC